MKATHYTPPFVYHRRGRDQAVCGTYIDKDQFSTEPTCAICAQWLVDDEAGIKSLTDDNTIHGGEQ